MGKYIIEVDDKYVSPDSELNGTLIVSQKNLFDGDYCSYHLQIAKLTPYAEPDLDAIRKDAFDEGYQEGMQLSIDDAKLKEAYRRGLNDAWEATRKIANMDSEERGKIFGEIFIQNIQNIYSASEAIEKIREYEKEEIQVGDEVIYDGKRCVVVFPQTEHLYATIMNCGRFHHTYVVGYDELTKTGRHFPELVEILQKMKEAE